jgi:hypothetical protein
VISVSESDLILDFFASTIFSKLDRAICDLIGRSADSQLLMFLLEVGVVVGR